jgi:hypothetical protein
MAPEEEPAAGVVVRARDGAVEVVRVGAMASERAGVVPSEMAGLVGVAMIERGEAVERRLGDR